MNDGKQSIRDPFLFAKKRKRDGSFPNGRSYGFFLPEVLYSVSHRHYSVWFIRARSMRGPEFLPSSNASFPLGLTRNRSMISRRSSSFGMLVNNVRTLSLVGGHAERKVLGDKGATNGSSDQWLRGGRWKIRKRNSYDSMNITSRVVVSTYDGGDGAEETPRRACEGFLNYSPRVSLPGWKYRRRGSNLADTPRRNTPGVYITRGFYSSRSFRRIGWYIIRRQIALVPRSNMNARHVPRLC